MFKESKHVETGKGYCHLKLVMPCTQGQSKNKPGAGDQLTALQEMVPVPRRSPGRRLQPPTVWWATIWGSVQYLAQTQHHCQFSAPSLPDSTHMCFNYQGYSMNPS